MSSWFRGSAFRIAHLSPSFFLEATATAYALSSIEGDLPGAVVICWTLWAIFAHQRTPYV